MPGAICSSKLMNENVIVFCLLELSHISEGCVRKVRISGFYFIVQTVVSRPCDKTDHL